MAADPDKRRQEDRKPLDEKQLVARRKEIDDKKAELAKLESDTPKYYLGRPVTIIAETHPSREWTIRFDDTNETETVQKFSVTDTDEDINPVRSATEVRAEHFGKIAQEKAEKKARENPQRQPEPVETTVAVTGKTVPNQNAQPQTAPAKVTKSDAPVKDSWFKK